MHKNSPEPLLRIYEGCGRAYLGVVEGANIINPDFETEPPPALLRCVKLTRPER